MRRTIFLLLAAISVCLAGASPAQADSIESSPIDLKFEGGTVSQYAQALRETSDGVNIVVMPDAADVELGPIELKQADLFASIMLLDDYEQVTSSRITHLDVEPQPSVTDAGLDIFVINGIVRDMAREQPATSMVLTVSQLLTADPPIPAEDILSAVEAAMELTKGILQAPDISFHKETGLIIARGHPEQMNTIESVIDQLRTGVRMQQQEQRQARMNERDAEMERMHRIVDEVQNQRNLLETSYQVKMAELKAQLAQREQQIIALQEEIDNLKKQ